MNTEEQQIMEEMEQQEIIMEIEKIKKAIKNRIRFKNAIKNVNNRWFIEHVKYRLNEALCFDGEDVFIGTWSSGLVNINLMETNTKKSLYSKIDEEIKWLKKQLIIEKSYIN